MHLVPHRAVSVSMLAAGLLGAALLVSCHLPGGTGSRADKAALANKRCYECHIDFQGEELALTHQAAGVTCVRCHGYSKPHLDDEVRKTPPDAIFRGKAMKVFCLTCHDPAKHGAVPQHRAAEARGRETGKEQTCTECHGEHRLIHDEPADPSKPKAQ